MKKKELKIKQELTGQETVDLFNEIGNSISEGVLTIEYGDKQICLKPGCRFDTSIEASSKKNKQKLTIEISWKDDDKVCVEKPALKISSQQPVVEESVEDETKKTADEAVTDDDDDQAEEVIPSQDIVDKNVDTERKDTVDAEEIEESATEKEVTEEKVGTEATSETDGFTEAKDSDENKEEETAVSEETTKEIDDNNEASVAFSDAKKVVNLNY